MSIIDRILFKLYFIKMINFEKYGFKVKKIAKFIRN